MEILMNNKTHKLSSKEELEIARLTLNVLGFTKNISNKELKAYTLSIYKNSKRKEKYTDWVKKAKHLLDGLKAITAAFKPDIQSFKKRKSPKKPRRFKTK